MKARTRQLVSMVCAVVMVVCLLPVLPAGAETVNLFTEGFNGTAGTDLNGWNGWANANEYTYPNVDDNVYTVAAETEGSSNLVASFKKTGTDSSVTDKNRKWVAKAIAAPTGATTVTIEFKLRAVSGTGSFDIGLRGADGSSWTSNGLVRLSLGTTSIGVAHSDGQYYWYEKLTADTNWHTIRLVVNKAGTDGTGLLSVYVNDAASGSQKLSAFPILTGSLPTAIGFGWVRSVVNTEAQIDDLTVTADVPEPGLTEGFNGTAGTDLNGWNGWANANEYTYPNVDDNVYTVAAETEGSSNLVASFKKTGTDSSVTDKNRKWIGKDVYIPSDTESVEVTFKLRLTGGTSGRFDIGFYDSGTWGDGNGCVGILLGSSENQVRLCDNTYGGSSLLKNDGSWEDVLIRLDYVSGTLSVYLNGSYAHAKNFSVEAGSHSNHFGTDSKPSAIGFGWRRSDAGVTAQLDDLKIEPIKTEEEIAESFTEATAGEAFIGYNSWKSVNEYTAPGVADNAYTVTAESETSDNLVASLKKTATEYDASLGKNRLWVGKNVNLPEGTEAVALSFKIRWMSETGGRFDIGLRGADGSWGTGDGFVGIHKGTAAEAGSVRLIDNTYKPATGINPEIGAWNDVTILLDYTIGKFAVKFNGTTSFIADIDRTYGHLAGGIPKGVAFGWARNAAGGSEVQLDDIIYRPVAPIYPTIITDITVEENKLKSFTLTNKAALSGAVAYAAVYDVNAAGQKTLSDLVSVALTEDNAAVGEKMVITPARELSVPEGDEVAVFVWNGETLQPCAYSKTRAKAAAIDFDGATLPAAGDTSKTFTVHVIGDSTAAAYEDSVAPLTGWAQVLGTYFTENVTVNDDAISGESSRSFYEIPAHWQATIGEVQAGDYVLIQFGSNDEKSSGTSLVDTSQALYTSPQGTYKEYLTKFIDETLAKQATPILVTSINRRVFDENGNVTAEGSNLMAYVDAMKELAETKEVTLIDLNAKSKLLYEYYGEAGSKALFMNFGAGEYDNFPNGREDNSHLRDTGAHEIAKLFALGCIEEGHVLGGYVKK